MSVEGEVRQVSGLQLWLELTTDLETENSELGLVAKHKCLYSVIRRDRTYFEEIPGKICQLIGRPEITPNIYLEDIVVMIQLLHKLPVCDSTLRAKINSIGSKTRDGADRVIEFNGKSLHLYTSEKWAKDGETRNYIETVLEVKVGSRFESEEHNVQEFLLEFFRGQEFTSSSSNLGKHSSWPLLFDAKTWEYAFKKSYEEISLLRYTVTGVDMSKSKLEGRGFKVDGFKSIDDAIEYAMRRVRASVEKGRLISSDSKDLLNWWFDNGEYCEVEAKYYGIQQVGYFIANPAESGECDYESLTPE